MHTPYPWTVEPATKNGDAYIFAGPDRDKTLVAFVYLPDCKDNARLIAQAPFLLLALKELIGEHDAQPLPQGWYYWPDTGGMTLARQAVAQATGNADDED